MVVGAGEYICDTCGRSFRTPQALASHRWYTQRKSRQLNLIAELDQITAQLDSLEQRQARWEGNLVTVAEELQRQGSQFIQLLDILGPMAKDQAQMRQELNQLTEVVGNVVGVLKGLERDG